MKLRSVLLGERRARLRVATLAVAVPVLASVAFLLEYDVVLTVWLLSLTVALALYAGWARAGVVAGCGVVFVPLLWRFVFPPLIGYLRWSWDLRYTPPRVLGYKLDPRGEFIEGITHGPVYALAGALVFGGAAYCLGALVRRLGEKLRD